MDRRGDERRRHSRGRSRRPGRGRGAGALVGDRDLAHPGRHLVPGRGRPDCRADAGGVEAERTAMVNVLVVAFLLLHGAVHLGVWMPHPPAADGTPVPFEPDHSAVLSRASVGVGVERRIATALAYATAAAYVGAGLAVAAGNSWAVGIAVLASALG